MENKEARVSFFNKSEKNKKAERLYVQSEVPIAAAVLVDVPYSSNNAMAQPKASTDTTCSVAMDPQFS